MAMTGGAPGPQARHFPVPSLGLHPRPGEAVERPIVAMLGVLPWCQPRVQVWVDWSSRPGGRCSLERRETGQQGLPRVGPQCDSGTH